MLKKVSLIIPSQNAKENLLKLLKSIIDWENIPNEIIIIDSSDKKISISEDFESFIKKLNIRLSIIHEKNLYPGHARNIGIVNSRNALLAFLDTSTQASKKWLSNGLNIINKENIDGIWGHTYYEANTYTAKIIRASTYGSKPIQTFPGSIIKKNVFNVCGLFIESARAGEDGDWVARTELHKMNITSQDQPLIYNELNRITIKKLLKKWFRNYSFSARLPHGRVHKDFYFYIISFVTVLTAYNWNSVIASWQTDSIYFIPYITRISILVLLFIYITIRGILLPKKKGINFGFIFPFNFLIISFISALIDLTKALAFGYSRFIKK